MKFSIPVNLPYIEHVGHAIKSVVLAPKRAADNAVETAMVSALEKVTAKMRAELDLKEQA
jgi:hypothetical protein